MPNLGQALKESRNEAGLSQSDVADAIHVSRQSVSKWENNTQMPDISRVQELCQMYGVSIDQLMDGLDESGQGDISKESIHNELNDEENVNVHNLVDNLKDDYTKVKTQTRLDDSALLLILTGICAFIPVVDVIAPFFIIWKNKKTNRYYWWINIICCVTWLMAVGSYIFAFTLSNKYM